MIPDEKTVKRMWDKYHLPLDKKIHCEMVRKVVLYIARKINEKNFDYRVNEHLLISSALLHDIDKNIDKLPGECHPDAGVRILKLEGMDEVAEMIRTHPLHMICDSNQAFWTIEQKILFLADKMTKQNIIGLEKRFGLWRSEDDDDASHRILDASYPKVVALRDEILQLAGITEEELILLMK